MDEPYTRLPPNLFGPPPSVVPPPRLLSDRAVVVAALAVALGAFWAPPVPWPMTVLSVLAALAWRRPVLVVVAGGLVAAVLAQRAWAGTTAIASAPFAGEVTLVTDPEPFATGVRAIVDLGGTRVEASAFGGAARRLAPRLAGERVVLGGRLQPPQPRVARWLATKHVRGRLAIDEVGAWHRGPPPSTAANGLRRLLEHGAASLSDERRSLLMGLVLGDDRAQSDEMRATFQAAGLTHLLAVSGQNVAFVLLAASPLLSRLRLRPRLVTTLGLLAFFALMTRFEPSVLRATAMAGGAAFAASLGRPTSGLRILALACSALLLIDPLLVHQLGFQLSVLATAGILLLGGRVAAWLPGPRWLALPLSVTVAAQVFTSPLLAATIGPVPVAALPANLLAEPAAGAAMTYGLVGGLAAGLLPAPLAAVVHLPTRALLWWIATSARWSAGLGLPTLGLGAQAVVAGIALAVWWRVGAHRRRRATVGPMSHPAAPLSPGPPPGPTAAPAPEVRR